MNQQALSSFSSIVAARPERRTRWLVTSCIWSLFAIVLLSLVSFCGASISAAHTSTHAVSSRSATSLFAAGSSTPIPSSSTPLPSPSTAHAPIDCSQGCVANYTSDPQALLPAWRWSSASFTSSPGDVPNVGSDIMYGLAGILFSISSFFWKLLLALFNWALNMDLISSAAKHINDGFLAFARSITGSGVGVIALILFFGATIAVRQMLRGRVTKAISTGLIMIIPLAALWAMTGITASGAKGTLPKGSPAWIGVTGSNLVSSVGNELATGFGSWSGITNSPVVTGSSAGAPSCTAYSSALYDQYYAYSNAATQSGTVPSGVNAASWASYVKSQGLSSQLSTVNSTGLTTVSSLWQQAWLSPWVDAEFGSASQGSNIYCHLLEYEAGVPASEQYALLGISGTYDGRNYTSGPTKINPGVFSLRNLNGDLGNITETNLLKGMLAWQACAQSPSGTWSARAGWQGFAGSGDPSVSSQCSDWFTSASGPPTSFGTGHGDDLANTLNGNNPGGSMTQVQAQELNMVQAMKGQNGAQALMDGVLALLTSLVYLWALGALAVGTILAQIGLVLLLAALPITLVLLAIPTKEGGRIRTGTKLLRMTMGFIVSKLTLTLVLLVLLQSILLVDNLVNAGGSGFMSSIITAAVPLICLFLMKKILSAVGLGNITSLPGALSMPLAAAALASGDQSLRSAMTRGIANTHKKLGLDKAQKAFKSAPKSTAKWGAKRLAATNRGAQLLGRRDPKTGKLTELGMLQRVSSLAGALDMAKSSKIGGVAKLAEGLSGSRYMHGMIERSSARAKMNPETNYEVAALHMQERRELAAATSGKFGADRTLAIREFYQDRGERYLLGAGDGVLRDDNGEILSAHSGKPIMIYDFSRATRAQQMGTYVDPDGTIKDFHRTARTEKRQAIEARAGEISANAGLIRGEAKKAYDASYASAYEVAYAREYENQLTLVEATPEHEARITALVASETDPNSFRYQADYKAFVETYVKEEEAASGTPGAIPANVMLEIQSRATASATERGRTRARAAARAAVDAQVEVTVRAAAEAAAKAQAISVAQAAASQAVSRRAEQRVQDAALEATISDMAVRDEVHRIGATLSDEAVRNKVTEILKRKGIDMPLLGPSTTAENAE
jgi:hypothetical protein